VGCWAVLWWPVAWSGGRRARRSWPGRASSTASSADGTGRTGGGGTGIAPTATSRTTKRSRTGRRRRTGTGRAWGVALPARVPRPAVARARTRPASIPRPTPRTVEPAALSAGPAMSARTASARGRAAIVMRAANRCTRVSRRTAERAAAISASSTAVLSFLAFVARFRNARAAMSATTQSQRVASVAAPLVRSCRGARWATRRSPSCISVYGYGEFVRLVDIPRLDPLLRPPQTVIHPARRRSQVACAAMADLALPA
jgi:hypothetical protein